MKKMKPYYYGVNCAEDAKAKIVCTDFSGSTLASHYFASVVGAECAVEKYEQMHRKGLISFQSYMLLEKKNGKWIVQRTSSPAYSQS